MPVENLFEQMQQSYQDRKNQEKRLQEDQAVREVERRSVKDTLEEEIRSDFLSVEEGGGSETQAADSAAEDAEEIQARADAARTKMEKDVLLKSRIRLFLRRKKSANPAEEAEPALPEPEALEDLLFEEVDTDSDFHLDFVLK